MSCESRRVGLERLMHALFCLALALFVCHEMDAVARHEWQLLPLFDSLDGEVASTVFILLHVPVFALLFWLVGHRSDDVRLHSQLVFDDYLLLHALLHRVFSGHADYEFEAPIETITVYGGALVGLVHALLFLVSMRYAARNASQDAGATVT